MAIANADLKLSIIITIVGGTESTRSCLQSIDQQRDRRNSEIIVPFDADSLEIGELADEFPAVRFHFIENQGLAADRTISARTHRLYDRRRAVGISLANGEIIAMTEDQATPASDWCEKIVAAHAKNTAAAIGGAIENGTDTPLNWALYYLDFGRYGRPLRAADAEYVSDVNVSYKREALLKIRSIWSDEYHETAVHQALRTSGEKLCLNESIVVFENRPPISFAQALRERIEWGRIYAEIRALELTAGQRAAFAAGTSVLPFLLLYRAVGNMRRQKRSWSQIAKILPITLPLLVFWSLGEGVGYINQAPREEKTPLESRQVNAEIDANSSRI